MTVFFDAVVCGDGECFCWDQVKREDKVRIVGEDNYRTDLSLEEDFHKEIARERGVPYDETAVQRALEHLYPGDVMIALGCKPNKRYRFTVSVEEVD